MNIRLGRRIYILSNKLNEVLWDVPSGDHNREGGISSGNFLQSIPSFANTNMLGTSLKFKFG